MMIVHRTYGTVLRLIYYVAEERGDRLTISRHELPSRCRLEREIRLRVTRSRTVRDL